MKHRRILLSTGLLIPLTLLFLSFAGRMQPSFQPNQTDTLPAFAKAKDHLGKNVSNTNGLLSLTTGIDNSYYLQDSQNRIGYLYLEAKIGRYVGNQAKKNPLNIAIVLDRSGSMAGEKMEFAKKAAIDIIDKLGPEDFVSVVIYDEFIDVIQPATSVLYKDSIKFKISKVKPRGSTNLWGGSDKGYEQVKANYKKNYVNRVLLISDGNITAGPKIPSRIIAQVQAYKDINGISISTFGVGLDYNETLMTDMAENGAGNYYFIDRADKMAAIFDKELYGLLNVVAQNAELRITLPKGVTVEKLYPFQYALEKNEVVIKFQDLFSEDIKGLIMRFRIDNESNKELPFTSRLVYTDNTDNQAKTIVNENMLTPIKIMEQYLASFNKTVAEQVVLFTANENMEKAMYEVDRGNYEAARRYAEANGYIFTTNSQYVNGSGELQKMDSITRFYATDIANIKVLSKDSVKLMQKDRRAQNYQIRNKKGQ
ncbi:MAG TPA: VWA domain-containing protein [Flavisolibacter sp.]|jgi:Ca-activated chloride channel family protein|nr:VWA domain-containing protein [Flavisolibacter sp.]